MKTLSGLALVASVVAFSLDGYVFGQGKGKGQGKGLGKVKGQNQGEMAKDQDVFHYLLDHRKEITRKVLNHEKGVETLTESDNPEVAKVIKIHVASMSDRMAKGNGIRLRDPLFAALFQNYKKVQMKAIETPKGVKVIESSDDPRVVTMIQAHAKVVSAFIEIGYPEAMRNHELPK